ncbi:hypothetical protein [Gimesia sp.]|uniref:hypothetical protein n=1 Tax=Gimesia sp. TaxID=2024833 RepID=UPI003A911D9E
MSDPKPTCFIIMPISTPGAYHERYKQDKDHFKHVLDCLLIPAVEEAGFEAIPPIAEGAEHIHAKIISTLTDCDLVLCDMSILNANVFFELGVRTALDKPVALIADSETAGSPPGVPFDVSNINFHTYNPSLTAWETKDEIPALVNHIEKCVKSSDSRNTLWKYYGVTQKGMLNPEDATVSNKLDLILTENTNLRSDISALQRRMNLASHESSLSRKEEKKRLAKILNVDDPDNAEIYLNNRLFHVEIADTIVPMLLTDLLDLAEADKKNIVFSKAGSGIVRLVDQDPLSPKTVTTKTTTTQPPDHTKFSSSRDPE